MPRGDPSGSFVSPNGHFSVDANPQAEGRCGGFTNPERIRRQDDVLEVMRLLEPRLRRLAVLVTGDVATINGDIGVGQLVPAPLMGEGMGRLHP